MKWLLMMMLMSTAAFAGDRGGNGGGGFCYDNGKCVTLAEAGLRIPRGEINLFMPSQQLEAELARILDTLPLPKKQKKDFLKLAMGERETFIKVEEDNGRKFRKIVASYRKLIQTYAPKLEDERFTLYAVSTEQKTYLLPTFFDLSDTDQALILLHEGNVRGFPSSVIPNAVRFDGMIFDYLTAAQKPSPVDFYLSLYDLSTEDHREEKLFANMLSFYSSKIGRALRTKDFCAEDLFWEGKPFYQASENSVLSGGWISSDCKVDREQAFNGDARIDPSFSKLFYGMRMELETIYGGPELGADHDNGLFFDKSDIPSLCSDSKDGEQLLLPGRNGFFVAVVSCKMKDGKVRADSFRNIKISGITTR